MPSSHPINLNLSRWMKKQHNKKEDWKPHEGVVADYRRIKTRRNSEVYEIDFCATEIDELEKRAINSAQAQGVIDK